MGRHDGEAGVFDAQLDLADMFRGPLAGTFIYRLKAITSFYGAHYIVSLKPQLREPKWIRVDDETGTAVSSFDVLVEKAAYGKQLPVLLFFERVR